MRCCHLYAFSVATCPGFWVICSIHIMCYLITLSLSLCLFSFLFISFCFYVFLLLHHPLCFWLFTLCPILCSLQVFKKKLFPSFNLLFLTYYIFQFSALQSELFTSIAWFSLSPHSQLHFLPLLPSVLLSLSHLLFFLTLCTFPLTFLFFFFFLHFKIFWGILLLICLLF